MSSSISAPKNIKFLFDREFGDKDAAPDVKIAAEIVKLEKIRTEAFSKGEMQGLAQGREEKARELEGQIVTLLAKIQKEIGYLIQHTEQQQSDILELVHTFTLKALQKIHPELSKQGEVAEICALMKMVMAEQLEEPRLGLHVHPDCAERMAPELDKLIEHGLYRGKITIFPDQEMQTGDCRIEWQQGGLERDVTGLTKAIEDILSRRRSDHGK